MMAQPDISVLVVTHNHVRHIDAALASIAAQHTELSVEVVIADDDSTDGTREIAERWAQTAPFPARVLEAAERLGITRNYERGFAACSGRYIAVLEGDDEWISVDKLELQAAALEDNPDLSMVATRFLLYETGTGRTTARPVVGGDRFLTRITSERLADNNWFGTFSACMYRTEYLRRIPAEVFDVVSYDWMIALAITEFGDAALVPQVCTMYRAHPGGTWSGSSGRARAEKLLDLIPTYMSVLGGRLDRQLSRVMHGLEHELRELALEEKRLGPPIEPKAARSTEEQAPTLPLPRVGDARRPTVSVVMTSYNHEKYVVEAAQSVLSQSFADLEFVIVDDFSTDGSLSRLAKINDPRVRIYALPQNIGGAAALNFAIQQTRGEYVAIINSDDVWMRHKLERQLAAFAEKPHVAAVFTDGYFTDEDGKPLKGDRIPEWSDVFRQPNRSQGQWLRYFLTRGNALCHPSVLIRRAVYEEIGLYDNTLRQLPDLDRWVALVKAHPIEVLGSEPLVRFRTFASKSNASSSTPTNIIRTYHEHTVITQRLFAGASDELIRDGFGDILRFPNFSTDLERRCALAFVWLDAEGPLKEINRVQALTEIRSLLLDPDTKLLLLASVGVDDAFLHELAGQAEGAKTLGVLEALAGTSFARPRDEDKRRGLPGPVRVMRALGNTPTNQWPRLISNRLRRRV